MPSPIAHGLAGSAIASLAWVPRLGVRYKYLTLACVGLALAPDLDLLVPTAHRTFTHSVGAVAAVTIISIAVTGKVRRSGHASDARRIVLACVCAYASHLLMDWIAVDST